MFSRFKRKQGGKGREKVEFRFQFQASGVPVSGFPRLLVCVLPPGKYKSAGKTQKAPVRNGSALWPEAVGVRTKLNRDKKGAYDEAVFRFVVSGINSSTGVLGEASLNLANCIDYVQKEKSLVLSKGSLPAGTVLHATITCVRLGARDGNDSASNTDDDGLSEEDISEDVSESTSEPSRAGGERRRPLQVKVPVDFTESRGSRLSQESRDFDEAPTPSKPVLRPMRPTGRLPPQYDVYATNGESRPAVPTLAPIAIKNQVESLPDRRSSWGGAQQMQRSFERGPSDDLMATAQLAVPRGPPARHGRDISAPRPSRSGSSFSEMGGPVEPRFATPQRRSVAQNDPRYSSPGRPRSGPTPADLLSVLPPRGVQKPSRVLGLAAQFDEQEAPDSPQSSTSQSSQVPRYQSANRYAGRREVPMMGRASLDSGGSSVSQGADFRSFSSSKLRHFEGEADLMQELERMEVEIEGLRAQSESWQRSAKNYALENEQLRAEMKVQIQYTDEAGAEADEASRERDELRIEVAKLRDEIRVSHEQANQQATAQWEAVDAKRHVEELQEELEQQKEQVENLKVQLEKIHESNQMLVEEVRDFEEQRDAKDAELQRLQQLLANYDSQPSVRPKSDGSRASDLIADIAALEKKNAALAARLEGSNLNGQDDKSNGVQTLQKRVAELEAEASELTEESMKLAGDLTGAQAEVRKRQARVEELERALQLREPQLVSSLGASDKSWPRDEALSPRLEEVNKVLGGLTMLKTLTRGRANESADVSALRNKFAMLLGQVEQNVQELSRANDAIEQELAAGRSEAAGSAERMKSLEENLQVALATARNFEAKLQDASDLIARHESGEEVVSLREQVLSLQTDLRATRYGKDTAPRAFERLKSDAASETIQNLSEELEAAQTTIRNLESELENAHQTIQQLDSGAVTPRGIDEGLNVLQETILNLRADLTSSKETIATLKADLASAREGRDNVSRQYDRLKQLLDEDRSEERIEELENEVQELRRGQLASTLSTKSGEDADLLAQIVTLESAREALTGQLATQAQEAQSARLELEQVELGRAQAQEKLRSLEAELAQLKEARSAEKEEVAATTTKGSPPEAMTDSQLDETRKKVQQLEEEVKRQSFIVSKAEGAAFEAEERLKLAHVEFSEKSNAMVEKMAQLEERFEQLTVQKKDLETKHRETLRGLEMRHGEKEQELQRNHLAEWGELHALKQALEGKHGEVLEQKSGLEEQVRELTEANEELEGLLASERKQFEEQTGKEKQQLEEQFAQEKQSLEEQISRERQDFAEKWEHMEAEMASVTAQLNESLRVETQMAREHAEKEKALQEEAEKLEAKVKELEARVKELEGQVKQLTMETEELVRAKEAVQKMWDDSEVSGKDFAEKIRALRSQLDETELEMKYKGEECEELNARIEELHSLVEDSQAQADEYKQQAESANASVAELQAQLAHLTGERDTHVERGVQLAAVLEEHKAQLAAHEERATTLTNEMEGAATAHSKEAAEQAAIHAALLSQHHQKIHSLESQVAKLTAQNEDHVAAKEAVHRRMSFAMQEGVVAGAKVQELEQDIERLKQEMEGHVTEKEELQGQLADAHSTKTELETSLRELQTSHEGLVGVKSRLEEEHSWLRDRHEEVTTSRDLALQQHEEVSAEKEGLMQTLASHENVVRELEQEVTRLTSELKTQGQRCEQLEATVRERENAVKDLTAQVKEADEERERVAEEMDLSLARIQKLESQIRTLTEQLDTLQKEAGELRSAKSALETQLGALAADHKETATRALSAEGKVDEMTSHLAMLTSQLHEHASSKQEVEARALDLHSELSGLQERLSASESAHKGVLESLSSLTAEAAALQTKARESESKLQGEIAELAAAKKSLTGKLESLQAHASEMAKEVNELKECLAEVETSRKGLTEKVSSLTEELTSREKGMQEAEAGSQAKIIALFQERDSLTAELEHLKAELARSLADKQAAVEEMRTLHEQFQAGASDKERAVSEALMAATAVRAEKADLEERVRKHEDEQKEVEGVVSELEKRVKALDQDLEVAKRREGQLEIHVNELDASLKEANGKLERTKLDAAESAKKWQAEQERLESLLQGAKTEALETAKRMEAEQESTLNAARADALEKHRSWTAEVDKKDKAHAESKGQWEIERQALEGRLEESVALSRELTAAKEALEVRQKELLEQTAGLQKSIDELTTLKGALTAQVGSLNALLEKETKARGELESELELKSAKLGDLGQSSSDLQRSLEDLRGEKRALASEIERLKAALEKETGTRKSIEVERDSAQEALKECSEALLALKTSFAGVEAEKSKFETAHQETGRELLELNKKRTGLEAQVAELEKERTALAGHVSEAERKVEVLTAQLSEAREGLAEVQSQREQLQKELHTSEQTRTEAEGMFGSKTRALEIAAAAAASELAALQKAHNSLQSALSAREAEHGKTKSELEQHQAELTAHRKASDIVVRQFAEHKMQAVSDLESVQSDLASKAADVDRLNADVARVRAELAQARADFAEAAEGRATAERQLAESTARMKSELAAALAQAGKDKEEVVGQLEARLLQAHRDSESAVASAKQEMQQQIEELIGKVETEKASAKRLAMQAANSASAETEELRDENFTLKHRLIELETEMKSNGGARRFSASNNQEEENALSELRMKVTMLETELRNKGDQLTAAEKRLQEAREEGVISSGGRPNVARAVSLTRGGVPELLVSPSGRSLLSPGTRRTLSASRNGRDDSPEFPPDSPADSPTDLEAKRVELQHRVRSLEGDLKKVITILEKSKKEALEKERGLLAEVDRLQAANEQLAQGGFDLGMDQLRSELLRLQNQNAALTRSERELQTQLGLQEVLEEEVLRLQETNDELFQKISLYRQYGDRARTVERLHTLEVELQEALEANMMYKEQLKAALNTHQNVSQAAFSSMGGDVDMILDELKTKKQQARRLESELQEMQSRYTALSLKCAEVEAHREELVQEMKRLKGGGQAKKPGR